MKRFLSAALIACLLMNPAALAEGEGISVQPETTLAPVQESGETPKPEALAAPFSEETVIPTVENTVEPQKSESAPEVSATAEAALEENATNAPETSDIPSASPENSATPVPDASATQKAEEGDLPKDDAMLTPEESITPNPEESVTPAPEGSTSPAPEESTSPTPDSSATPEPETDPTLPPEIPKEAEAWIVVNDQVLYGTLEEMIAAAEEDAEIVLHIETPMFVKEVSLKRLTELKWLLDEEVFDDETMEYSIAFSTESPDEVEEPALIDLDEFKDVQEDVAADLYIWVVQTPKMPEETENPDDDPTQMPETNVQIQVEVDSYTAAQWNNVHPTFVLGGIPEDQSNWSYAVIIYDERIAILSENEYTANEEGVYTVRFAILDASGDIVSASERYTLWLDHTLPQVEASVDETQSYTLNLMATDTMSGVQALTLDGGATWMDWQNDVPYTYVVAQKNVLEPGMVQVRDAAGNVWISVESYTLDKIVSYSGGGYGGGGGGGSGTPAKQHAKAESTEKTAEYDALLMKLPDEPMHLLTIDGEELALTLELTRTDDFEIPEDYEAMFTAELAVWTEEPAETEEETDDNADEEERTPDTLVLTAVMEENLGDRFEYRWKFNGEVYRMLANSNIRYLALCIGDDMTVLPTEGFVGGTKYTELKMLGVATKKFDYTIAMNFDLDPDHIPMLSENDFSENCDIAIQTEVENMKYVLSTEQKGEMYYYNVFLGPQSMMDQPYGQFIPENSMIQTTNPTDHD